MINNIDSLIEAECFTKINNTPYNAINHVILNANDGVLFTLALHDHLKLNTLKVDCEKDKYSINVNNLFGEKTNTEFVCDLIKKSIVSKRNNFEKLLALIGENIHSKRFLKGFESASEPVQEAIITHFQNAIDRNGASRFYADGILIKNVTPAKETKIQVFELRLFDPVAYRVYFYETSNKVYLGLIEKKPQAKVQDNHIENAKAIIKELVQVNG
ncbi:MAG: hypothetical protein HYZ42_04325 [Bacteroidetes bacterium]|nr:hypothetical protein [Bacteroidota bacterium]